ncbi:BNR repeat-like domain-containing protein [Pseudoxanthomonas sp. GM95]|uniref:exo-alpha-sialidase n=1 Tax=Pseudoxanthomonas sp. GM95 TaxID=1881043 RepID=UPI0008BD6294|nr:exo-alpha-sialidase [Pseudoxanthomonas sp. GM95]SEL60156.1 BNR repeat-like domain-containing protein [Pseudoxanthomonas sp. GM95]
MTKARPFLAAVLAPTLLCVGAAAALPASKDAAPVVGTRLATGMSYVSAVRMAHQRNAADNKRMLMVFEVAGDPTLPLYESRDDGDSWRQIGHLADQAHDGSPHWSLHWQPHLSELPRASGDLPAGTLLLAANSIERNDDKRITAQDMQLYTSADAGKTWHYRSSIVKGAGQPSDRLNGGVWEPYIVILDDGRMVAFYSSERHKREGFNQLLAHKVSSDGGRTWGEEVFDVALPGGVDRPGMAVVERLPSGDYAMVFENIDNTDGPRSGQVHIKFSRDGLAWNASDRGIGLETASGAWPSACPMIRWMPGETEDGVLLVAAQRAGGGGDVAGRTLYRNDTGGRGPWWETVAPVQKRTGNGHAGWTQVLLPRADGKLLHVTSSSSAATPDVEADNEILYASAPLALNRYEAEDAARSGSAQIEDKTASAGRRVRVAGVDDARLTFPLRIGKAGTRRLQVRFNDIGLGGTPQVEVNGQPARMIGAVDGSGWRMAQFDAAFRAGDNQVIVRNPAQALDYDYLQIDPVTP